MTFACPHCDASLRAPREKIGRKVRCGQCGGVLTLERARRPERDVKPARRAPPAAGKSAAKPEPRPKSLSHRRARPSKRRALPALIVTFLLVAGAVGAFVLLSKEKRGRNAAPPSAGAKPARRGRDAESKRLASAGTAGTASPSAAAAVENRDGPFHTRVLPVLRKKCGKCHRKTYRDDKGKLRKPKAGLRLDAAHLILRGSDDSTVLKPGKPNQSPLYTRTVLDKDDEDVMPSKGERLTKAEAAALRAWIAGGADFEGWVGVEAPPDRSGAGPLVASGSNPVMTLAGSVRPVPEAALERVRASGAIVKRLAPGHPLLRVEYVSVEATVTDAHLAKLAPVAANVTQLNLGRTKITSAGLQPVAAMRNLTRLDLHGTAVGDDGMMHLKGLTHLRYLNLYDTQVGDRGLSALAGLKRLQSLYLWKSKVTASGAARLKRSLPDTRINFQLVVPAPIKDEKTRRR